MAGLICLSAVVLFAQAAPAATVPSTTIGPASTLPVDETKLTIADNPQAATAGPTSSGFGVWDLVRMVIILGLVVASIYGVFYLIRRGQRPRIEETSLIDILGSQGLPGNRWVHLISVQKQVFLIGSSDASVNLISEITDQESIDELRLQATQTKPASPKNFSELLGSIFGGSSGTGSPGSGASASMGGGLDFIKRQRKRLTKYRE